MIASLWRSECKHCGREEHGFIVWMGDEEADALSLQIRERRARHLGGVEPCCCQEDWDREGEVELHTGVSNQEKCLE